MTPVDILTMMAVILAVLSIILLCVVIMSAITRITSKLQLSLPKKVVEKKTKKEPKKRRTENMSKDTASEGVTFNDIFMFMIAVPLVLLWVGFAGFVIHSGLQDDSVLEQIEGYTTLIAILGGPALLIIKDALDVWKQEQAEKTAFYKVKAQAVIDYNDAAQKQMQMIEAKAQEQEHKIETGTTLSKKK
jgi:Na+-transporting methylmalonyl-CoA/oxaloacetate decarboxylase gamma subunit